MIALHRARSARLGFPLLACLTVSLGCSAAAEVTDDTDPRIPDVPGVVVPPTKVVCDNKITTEVRNNVLLGLPSKVVTVSSPVVTPQTSKTPPELHYRKAVGVLNLSPEIRDAQAVEHVLRPMGIPYAVTTSPKLSWQHDLVVFFPESYPENFDTDELDTLKTAVETGVTLILKPGDVPALQALGGITGYGFNRAIHSSVSLTSEGRTEFPSLDHANERLLPLGGNTTEHLNTWTLDAATSADVTVLARYEDGSAAIVKRVVGTGAVYTIGVDWRDTVLRNQLGYSLGGERSYINVFEPATDAWMLMVRDIYDRRVPFGVRLHTSPDASRGALLLSHDLDWGPSYENGVVYAADEKARGASSTFFAHTKYVRDAQDEPFFQPSRAPLLARFLELGSTVGSHTVAHSKVLDTFAVGNGTEVYPTYTPINPTKFTTTGGTLFGEGRVSKSLIDAFLALCKVEHDVVSFRAGELAYNMATPETLERLGYRYDSSRAVGEVLTNFPYRLMTDWPDALDTSMFEFPVTLEDELPPRIDERVDAMLAVIEANANNGAPTTLLVHPNVLDYKLEAQQKLLTKLPSGVVAMGLEPFAEFWRARESVHVDAVDYDWSAEHLTVKLTPGLKIVGLTLRVGPEVDSVLSPTGARLVKRPDGSGFVALPPLPATTQATVVMHFVPGTI